MEAKVIHLNVKGSDDPSDVKDGLMRILQAEIGSSCDPEAIQEIVNIVMGNITEDILDEIIAREAVADWHANKDTVYKEIAEAGIPDADLHGALYAGGFKAGFLAGLKHGTNEPEDEPCN